MAFFGRISNALVTILRQWREEHLEYRVTIICPECIKNNRPDRMNTPCFTYEKCLASRKDDMCICEKANAPTLFSKLVPELNTKEIFDRSQMKISKKKQCVEKEHLV
jgi:hypothetical protein